MQRYEDYEEDTYSTEAGDNEAGREYKSDPKVALERMRREEMDRKQEATWGRELDDKLTGILGTLYLDLKQSHQIIPSSQRLLLDRGERRGGQTHPNPLSARERSVPATYRSLERYGRRQHIGSATTVTKKPNPPPSTSSGSQKPKRVVVPPSANSERREPHQQVLEEVSAWQRTALREASHFGSVHVWAEMSLAHVEACTSNSPTPNIHATSVALSILETLVQTAMPHFGDLPRRILNILKAAIFVKAPAPVDTSPPDIPPREVADGGCYRHSPMYFETARYLDSSLKRVEAKLDYAHKTGEVYRKMMKSGFEKNRLESLRSTFYFWRYYQVQRKRQLMLIFTTLKRSGDKEIKMRVYKAWHLICQEAKNATILDSMRSRHQQETDKALQELKAICFLTHQGEGGNNAVTEAVRLQKEKAHVEMELMQGKAVTLSWKKTAWTVARTVLIGDPYLDAVKENIRFLVAAMEGARIHEVWDGVERMLCTWANLHLRAASSPLVLSHGTDLHDGTILLTLIRHLNLCTPPTHCLHTALSHLMAAHGRFPLLTPLLMYHPLFRQLFTPENLLNPQQCPMPWYWWLLATVFVAKCLLPSRPCFQPLAESGFVPNNWETQSIAEIFDHRQVEPPRRGGSVQRIASPRATKPRGGGAALDDAEAPTTVEAFEVWHEELTRQRQLGMSAARVLVQAMLIGLEKGE